MSPEHRPLTRALLLSLLIHGLLLRITFGGQALGLPLLSFPWQERRIEAPDLRVVVVPAQVTAAEPSVTPVGKPLQEGSLEERGGRRPSLASSMSRASGPSPTAAAVMPEANPRSAANPRTDGAIDAAATQAPLRADRPGDTAPPTIRAPAVIALARTDESTWVVPSMTAVPPPARQPADLDAGRVELARVQPGRVEATQVGPARVEPAPAKTAQVEAAPVELARVGVTQVQSAQVEPARVEATRAKTAEVEAAPVELARVEPARVETAQVTPARVEPAPVKAAEIERSRVELARIEPARLGVTQIEPARVESAELEGARVKAAEVEGERVKAAGADAARARAAQEAEARRETRLRAIGRQLDEEAARREPATAAARLSPWQAPAWTPARRYRLFGRTDPNQDIILYAEAWERKIQLNMTFDMVREAAKQPHTDPIVKVAIRSDGSVESVTFVLSSGVGVIDDAIQRVVDSQKPYRVFPPSLASEYDVIEIRRTWYFDTAIRLH